MQGIRSYVFAATPCGLYSGYVLRWGAYQKNLSLKIIKAYELVIPPIVQQKKFMTFVQQVDKLKIGAQQAIDKLQMLYDSLAQEYFGVE